jgi:hypothetical protein
MDECAMTGCYDIARYFAEFENTEDREEKTFFLLEICESCADYWREHKEEKVRIWPYANNKQAARND